MPIINSLLEQDMYKYTMLQVVFHKFPDAMVEYEFKCRNKADLLPLIPDIKNELRYLCNLKLSEDELEYLGGMKIFKPDFIEFLRAVRLNINHVNVFDDNGQLGITVKGPWWATILFEIPILALVNELYFHKKWTGMTYIEGGSRLQKKIDLVRGFAAEFKFSDFGLRRRFCGHWHDTVVKSLKEQLPNNFVGTSNVYLARKYDLTPIGSMAHEYIMSAQAFTHIEDSQKFALENWVQQYGGGIALTDTLGMDTFLKDFGHSFCKVFEGCRHDSGDPYTWCRKLIDHYKSMGIDPLTKTAIFSDGLDIPKALDLARTFSHEIKTTFGIGTNITNDVGEEPLQVVMKMTSCNGRPVAKISDTPGKLMCKDNEYVRYLKHVFNIKS